jgi:Stress responsive A/B Barrel Domain
VIYHTQRLAFGNYVGEQEIEKYITDLQALERLDCVEKIVIGQDLGNPPDGFEKCRRITIMALVRDLQAYAEYMNDPGHVSLANRGSGRMLVQVINCDFSDDFDPDIRAKMDMVAAESAIDPQTRERAASISV